MAFRCGTPARRNCTVLANYLSKPADPFNRVGAGGQFRRGDCSAGIDPAGKLSQRRGERKDGARYRQAGLTMAGTLFAEPYLSIDRGIKGLLLHSVYHRPNGWDYVAPGQNMPNGESSMWGDYHLRELALLILREARERSIRRSLAVLQPRPEILHRVLIRRKFMPEPFKLTRVPSLKTVAIFAIMSRRLDSNLPCEDAIVSGPTRRS